MKISKKYLPVLALCAATFVTNAATLENNRYHLELGANGTITVANKQVSGTRTFAPKFGVLWRADDPKYRTSRNHETAYQLPSWNAISDGKGTQEFFAAGELMSINATSAKSNGGVAQWQFPDNDKFSFSAEVTLPEGNGEPKITFHFAPKMDGWFSIGYMGAPEISPNDFDSIWQPLVWQEKRFPSGSYLSTENMCSLPAVFAESKGATVGVIADPGEIPFRLPSRSTALFGVLLRNQAGNAQPMIFAPVFGGANSQMKSGANFSFSFRLVVTPGDCLAAFRDLSRGLFGFHDYRENGTCSLNETLENMIAFAMNDEFSGWIPELKGSDYATDVPGTVKNVSALHPLSIALVTDDEAIYRRRALPMAEYLLSREKYLFATREGITGQAASHLMRGPAAEVSELAALYEMFQKRTEIFRYYAEELYDKPRALNLNMVSKGGSWQNSLALYRLTGDEKYLTKAIDGANDYISKRIDVAQTDFSDVHVETGGQFWTDFAPKWADLFELYEESHDPRHLKAALAGASTYTTYTWMQPPVPDGDVLVNKGGKVGMYYTRRIPNPQPMRAAEQRVPAWRVSQIGLTPEASTTYGGNPAVLLTHYAAYMLRIGYLAHDSFLEDVARSAVVGRYANFPGYDINGEFTTVYQRPDYPLRAWRELTYNNIYYNHIWPHIALVMDFLVSDSFVKSDGQINFPSRYAQGYAYLYSKVYGDRPGTFYGDKNVRIWLPRKQLRLDTIQANYVAGYGNGNFYLALMNQSPDTLDVKITLNPDIVPVNADQTYTVQIWKDNQRAGEVKMRGGEMTVPLSGHGITALKVEGLKVSTQFQDHVFAPTDNESSKESFAIQQTPFGKVTSMLLSMNPSLTSAYIWLEATEKEVSQATLHYKNGKAETKIADADYPYEFSIPLSEQQENFDCWIEATLADGKVVRSEAVDLKR